MVALLVLLACGPAAAPDPHLAQIEALEARIVVTALRALQVDKQPCVTVAEAQAAASDVKGLSRLGRIRLHRGRDGGFDGFRLSAIREETLPHRLGLRNGDVVHAIDGRVRRAGAGRRDGTRHHPGA